MYASRSIQYDAVVLTSRLPEQQLFGMPVTLDVGPDEHGRVPTPGDVLKLVWKGEPVAVLQVSSVWAPDKAVEAHHVFGTSSLEHPGVTELAMNSAPYYCGGRLHGLAIPARPMRCKTPAEVRRETAAAQSVGSSTLQQLVAFQCRNPIHRSHWELIRRALAENPSARMLVHPVVGPTQPGDIDAVTRVETYEALAADPHAASDRVSWAFLPLNMRMAGPREVSRSNVQYRVKARNVCVRMGTTC